MKLNHVIQVKRYEPPTPPPAPRMAVQIFAILMGILMASGLLWFILALAHAEGL